MGMIKLLPPGPKVGDKVKIKPGKATLSLINKIGFIKRLPDQINQDGEQEYFEVSIPQANNKVILDGTFFLMKDEFEVLPDIFELWANS